MMPLSPEAASVYKNGWPQPAARQTASAPAFHQAGAVSTRPVRACPVIGNKTNDLAVLFPSGRREPLIVARYFKHPVFSEDTREQDEVVLGALGKKAVAWVI
jgi:hypothetical protein